jgi:hypothetical protein
VLQFSCISVSDSDFYCVDYRMLILRVNAVCIPASALASSGGGWQTEVPCTISATTQADLSLKAGKGTWAAHGWRACGEGMLIITGAVGAAIADGRLYCVVYTQRENTMHIISLRKANRRKVKRHDDET